MEKLQLKIKRNKFFSKRRITIVIVLLFMLSLGIGYAILVSDLNMNGTISMKEYNAPTLYNVLKREAVEGGLAREYTGEHHDSFTEEPSKKIYHYYSNSNSDSEEILNKNNVLFAGFCWKMYRTTDTGGVKLIYNGKAKDNQCITPPEGEYFSDDVTTDSLSGNYWYGTDFEYDKIEHKFVLTGEVNQYDALSAETAPNIIGKYTCKSTERDGCTYQVFYPYLYKDDNTAELLKLYYGTNRNYLGSVPFNNFNESMGDGGYMYGDFLAPQVFQTTSPEPATRAERVEFRDYEYTSNDFYVADSITYNENTGTYILVNPVLKSTYANLSDLVGKYSMFYTGSSSNVAYYIYHTNEGNNNNNYYYYYKLTGGKTAFTNMFIGDSYSGNGTYTINGATEVDIIDWHTNYNNYNGKFFCRGSDTCTNPQKIISGGSDSILYGDVLAKILIGKEYNNNQIQDTLLVDYIDFFENYSSYKDYIFTCDTESATCLPENVKIIRGIDSYYGKYYYKDLYYYGTSVTWDGTEYTLNNVEIIPPSDTYRFMCLEKGKIKCNRVAYMTDRDLNYYIPLENGQTTLQDGLNITIANNKYDSPTKATIDAWFKKYMTSYSDDLEDTIFCNNRAIADFGPFAPDGVDYSYLVFNGGKSEYDYDLSCPLVTDQFAVANNQAKLTYKVGMATYPETNLLGRDSISGYYYGSFRVMTPQHWTPPRVYMRMSSKYSSLSSWYSEPVKPVISLKPGTEYSTGIGTKEKPYVVGESHTITTDSNLFNHMKKALAGWTVDLKSNEYIVTSFKLNGVLTEGDSFVMPNEDVSITDIEYVVANYTITNNDNTVTVPSTGRYKTKITLDAGNSYGVSSFKLNGTRIEGNSFTMPAEDVVITDIIKYTAITVESDHYPCPAYSDSVVYYENTFAGAESISIELTYETYASYSDYVYIYDSPDGSPVNNTKYGGTPKTTNNITINSDYIRIVFRSNSGYSDYYGFKAIIKPNYPLSITNTNSLFNIPTSATPGTNVSITSDDYIVTSFKLNGTLVEGESFVMPYESVTITDIQYMQANYSITNTNSSITVPNTGRYGTTITLETDETHSVTSFKMNGTLIEGNSFTMPAENVTITEVTIVEFIIVESEHNPYANNINDVVYYEHTFDGATSITVELTYQTESTSYDWVYLYSSANGSPIGNKKYGGTTKKTETITVNGDYLKIVFRTDVSGNNYYGFKAVITPNYS